MNIRNKEFTIDGDKENGYEAKLEINTLSGKHNAYVELVAWGESEAEAKMLFESKREELLSFLTKEETND